MSVARMFYVSFSVYFLLADFDKFDKTSLREAATSRLMALTGVLFVIFKKDSVLIFRADIFHNLFTLLKFRPKHFEKPPFYHL